MLSHEENELLTRVERDAPMGRMMRRYWLPAALSEEVAERDGTPERVRLLGEDLVLFRDSDGRLGLIEAACPHRLASLALGRNEECGLRCVYHGWKFDVTGACTEMPTEPETFGFRERIRLTSYPVHEAGGLVWAYMGPAGGAPPPPDYDWMRLPPEQRVIAKIGERTNYLQAVEGAIDSSHSWFLHRGATNDWKKRTEISSDLSPKLEAEDTDYGFRYAAIRRPNANPEGQKYVRVTLFVVPTTAFIPRPLERDKNAHVQITAPVDDNNTMFYGVFFSQDGSPVDHDAWRENVRARRGVDLDEHYFSRNHIGNWWNQDRAAMKNGSWIGIDGFPHQDMACQESMGPIVDRTREHLGTSDIAIIRMRRRMLEAVTRFQRGEPLIGHEKHIPLERLRSEQLIVPIDRPWQSVGAYAGEYAHA
jgi:phthalate 4,5-dioxygenase oxygenase subunit